MSLTRATCHVLHKTTKATFPDLSLLLYFIQAVDIRQIYDKFPEKKGGLRELYEKGPQSVFFLVKFWVSLFNIDLGFTLFCI